MNMRAWILLLAVFAGVRTGNAQVATVVSGAVVDMTGAAIPDATVGLRLPGSETSLYAGRTTSSGVYTLSIVNPGTYDLAIEAAGFQTVVVKNVVVSPGRITDVPAMRLDLAAVEQTLFVTASENPQTSTAEVSFSLNRMQIENMPLRDRNPMMPVLTLPGVNVNAGAMMIINGNRPSHPNVTVDGISVLDSVMRSNAIDPLLLNQVAAVTVSTSNPSSAAYGGPAQVTFVTPSGTNDYHGNLYVWNRNSALAANTWFNNQSGTRRPFLNQNQIGGNAAARSCRTDCSFTRPSKPFGSDGKSVRTQRC